MAVSCEVVELWGVWPSYQRASLVVTLKRRFASSSCHSLLLDSLRYAAGATGSLTLCLLYSNGLGSPETVSQNKPLLLEAAFIGYLVTVMRKVTIYLALSLVFLESA